MYAVGSELVRAAAKFSLDTRLSLDALDGRVSDSYHKGEYELTVEKEPVTYVFRPEMVIVQNCGSFGGEHDYYQYATDIVNDVGYTGRLETPSYFSVFVKLLFDFEDDSGSVFYETIQGTDEFTITDEWVTENITFNSQAYRVTHPRFHATQIIVFPADEVGLCQLSVQDHTETSFLQRAHHDFNRLVDNEL